MVRRTAVPSLVVIIMMLGVVSGAYGQGEVAAPDEKGVPPNRDYLALLPFEVIDTASNNLILRFTDLVLPGNAGRSVRIERVFSNSTFGVGWRMGIAGVPMRVVEPPTRWLTESDFNVPWDLQQERRRTPAFQTLEGGAIRTTYWAQPTIEQASQYLVRGSDFGQYNRATRILLQPDGTRATYCAATELGCPGEGYLKELSDPFGNTVTLAWEATGSEGTTGYVTARLASLTQDLGNGQTREVTFGAGPDPWMPGSMTYLGRTWQYGFVDGELRTVTPPLGPGWTFEYWTNADPALSDGKVKMVTTPQGGTVQYRFDNRTYPVITPAFVYGTPAPFNVLVERKTNDGVQGEQRWTFEPLGLETSPFTQVVRPDGTELLYFYEPADPNAVLEGAWRLEHMEVRANGITVEADKREYDYLQAARTPASNALWGLSQPIRRTITRMGTTHKTEYAYGSVGAHFHNYHHPTTITERGPDGTVRRTTTRTYTHLAAMPSTPYLLGLPASEAVTEAGATTSSSRTYNIATGFRETETVDGVTTTFAPDARGNVATVTKANGKATEMTYEWGVVKDVTTQAGVNTTRTINPDGTVESETIANRTTTYEYDALSRRKKSQPPGGTAAAPITTTYDNATGQSSTTSRGSAFLTTTTDGFGRPIETLNSRDVRTRLRYDGEGRPTFQSYPFTTTEVGTEFDYDPLGRITQERNTGDDTIRTRTYDDVTNAVTVQDEEGRETVFTYRGYGHPDDARLVTVVDAADQTWTYTYDVRGNLAQVVTPTGHTRTWTRNSTSGLLTSETHPESGTTFYTNYDAAGVLKHKVDAKGTEFDYQHDGNDRLTRITAGTRVTNIAYEAGSDNRTVTADGTVTTTITYETTTGRPQSRQDAIGPYVYTTTYGYDTTDNLKSITYPTGRIVNYDVDSEHQITKVYEASPGPSYALAMTYHPSGAVATYSAGNGIATSITYDPQRYWVSRITSGALDLTYGNYDAVGNVGTIGDSRSGYGQSFTYDALDRLSTATGPWGSSSYPYDVHGNRQTANGTSYTYDAHLWLVQQATATGTATFGYDANGNMTSGPNASYTYTPEDWLATATNGGTTTSYVYDADGWRTRKVSGPDTTLYLRGLHGELLTEWKNPGPTGHTKEYVYAGSRLLAAIDRDRSTLPTACGGNAMPDGSPHPITISTPGGSATVGFDGSACRQVAVQVTVTSGSLGCPTISLLRPDGVALYTWSVSCVSSIFIDPVTLPYSGAYSVVVQAGNTSTGSADVRIYDVVDLTSQIVPNGPAVTLTSSTPGQRFKLTFDGVASRRYGFLAEQLSGNCLFITVNVLNPNLTTLGNGSSCGTAPFFDPPVPTASGQFTILIDPSGSNTGTVRVTLYESVDLTDSITANGAAVTKTFTTPGQQLRLTFDGLANHRYAFLAEQLSGGTCLLINVTVLNPNGTTLGSGGSCGTAPFFEPPVPTATGTFTIVIDPSAATIGTARVTLYDVTDITDSITPSGSAVTKTFTTPGQKLRLTFDGVANHRYAFLAEQLSGGTCLLINVTVLNPNGTTLGNGGSCATAPFFEPPVPTATGTFTILIDPPAATIGTARVTLYDVTDITDSITPNGAPVTKTFTTPGQNLRLTFDGVANHRYAFLAEQLSGGTCLLINVTVLNPNGTTLGSGGSCATAPFFEPPVPTATGTFTILIDPPGATIGTARVTLYDEVDVTGSLTINGAGVPVSLTTPGQMARLTFDITSTQQVTVRVTDGTIGFSTVRLLKPNGTEQTANSSSLGSFNLSTQTLTTPGTYTVVVDPSSTYTGSITVAVTSP